MKLILTFAGCVLTLVILVYFVLYFLEFEHTVLFANETYYIYLEKEANTFLIGDSFTFENAMSPYSNYSGRAPYWP